MKLYEVKYDSCSYMVEASSFMHAITAWHQHVKQLWGADYSGDEQPDSVALIHHEPIIRGQ